MGRGQQVGSVLWEMLFCTWTLQVSFVGDSSGKRSCGWERSKHHCILCETSVSYKSPGLAFALSDKVSKCPCLVLRKMAFAQPESPTAIQQASDQLLETQAALFPQNILGGWMTVRFPLPFQKTDNAHLSHVCTHSVSSTLSCRQ